MTTNAETYGVGEVSGLGTLSKVGSSSGVGEPCAGGGGGETGVLAATGVAEGAGVGVGLGEGLDLAFDGTEEVTFSLRGRCAAGVTDDFLALTVDGLLEGINRTEIGLGKSDPLPSTFTVCETYPGLLIVTVKFSARRRFTNFAGVTPRSPEESSTFASEGSLWTASFSWAP